LLEILDDLDFDASENVLDSLLKLREMLRSAGLILIPEVGVGGIEEKRTLRRIPQELGMSDIQEIIDSGEGIECEFKSTLLLDTKKMIFNPDMPITECASEEVLFSSVKSVAAFLNTNGGVLLLGVRDDGDVIGLEEDISIYPKTKNDFDSFELYFRDIITKYFIEGDKINGYLNVEKGLYGEKTFAKISVSQREKLSFIGRDGRIILYIRSGNRSNPINYEDIENYYRMEKLYG